MDIAPLIGAVAHGYAVPARIAVEHIRSVPGEKAAALSGFPNVSADFGAAGGGI
jgi:hypothetical protein